MIWSLKLRSKLRATPLHQQVAELPGRPWGIWECPITFTIPVSSKETNIWPAWDLVLSRDTGNFHWQWQRDTTTTSCMAGTNCGKHGLRGQSWPDRSCSDWPRTGYLVLWPVIVRRRTELRQDERCHIHIVGRPCLGWQTSPTQHQTSKPGWWLAVDHPSHHRRTHWTKGAWVPLFYPICINAIQFL